MKDALVAPGSCEYETDSTRIIHINDNLSGSWSTKITSFRPNLPECDIQYPAIESGNLVIRLGRSVTRVPGAGFNASVTKSIKYIKQDASVTEYNFRVFESGKKVSIPRQSRGLYDVSRSKRQGGIANAIPVH
jgi:hypothetical protein